MRSRSVQPVRGDGSGVPAGRREFAASERRRSNTSATSNALRAGSIGPGAKPPRSSRPTIPPRPGCRLRRRPPPKCRPRQSLAHLDPGSGGHRADDPLTRAPARRPCPAPRRPPLSRRAAVTILRARQLKTQPSPSPGASRGRTRTRSCPSPTPPDHRSIDPAARESTGDERRIPVRSLRTVSPPPSPVHAHRAARGPRDIAVVTSRSRRSTRPRGAAHKCLANPGRAPGLQLYMDCCPRRRSTTARTQRLPARRHGQTDAASPSAKADGRLISPDCRLPLRPQRRRRHRLQALWRSGTSWRLHARVRDDRRRVLTVQPARGREPRETTPARLMTPTTVQTALEVNRRDIPTDARWDRNAVFWRLSARTGALLRQEIISRWSSTPSASGGGRMTRPPANERSSRPQRSATRVRWWMDCTRDEDRKHHPERRRW